MSRSATFAQILASSTRSEVVAVAPEASARGAAMCAAVGVGRHADLRDAARNMAIGGRRYHPDEDDADDYDDAFERWQEREEQLEEF